MARQCQELLHLAMHRPHQRNRGELRGTSYAVVRKLNVICDRLLAERVSGSGASRLWVPFREQRAALFVFLYDPCVPPRPTITQHVRCANSVRAQAAVGGLLLFGDEASFTQWGSLGYTWAPSGQQPVVRTTGRRKAYRGAINYNPS